MISIKSLAINQRYGYFLIWGHGLAFTNDILSLIRKYKYIDILRIIKYKPTNIKKFVQIIYSHNYAPLHHLKNKTQYLLQTPLEVLFIFFRNNEADEKLFGEGSFQHTECLKIKKLKEKIRNIYNPRVNNKRTENHIIHASDNEIQVDYVLRYLGFEGINSLIDEPNNNLLLPAFISKFCTFRIKKVSSSQLYCNVLTGDQNNYRIETTTIDKSPHFAFLNGNKTLYTNYINKYLGGPLQCDYHLEKFNKLSTKMSYLEHPYDTAYIITETIGSDKYLIVDGLHRASVLLFNKINSFPVVIK